MQERQMSGGIGLEERVGVEILGEAVEDLKKAKEALVAIFSYHPPTYWHLHRVGELAPAIARELSLPEAEVYDCKVAAYLHDLGKFWMPLEILDGQGMLTPEETAVVKLHPGRGFRTAYFMQINSRSREAIFRHHERMDGSGYPGKLAGEAIPLSARIIAVADVLDVWTFGRPYQEAIGLEKALAVISGEGSRRWLDGKVVKACQAVFRNETSLDLWPRN